MKRIIAAALFALFASPALAASHLYISEYTILPPQAPYGNATPQIAQEGSLDQAVVDYTGGVAVSAAFQATTNYIRVLCTSTCSVKVSTSGTNATTSNKPLASGAPEYFGVQPGWKISVISNSDF